MTNGVHSGEFVFIKSVKDGIPNRDPLADSNARRIFDEADGRISLSDVSLKRDIRDYLIAKFEDVPSHKNYVYVQEKRTEDDKLLGRASLADELRKIVGSGAEKLSYRELLTQYAIDIRAFGVTFSVKNEKFDLTGPIQISWAHSMHPAETRYVQGTVVMPSKDVKDVGESGESEAKEQGTIWSTFILPFAVFMNSGVINASIAKQTDLTAEDVDLILEGLWRGTQHRQARGRGIQQPQFLLHVEYQDPFFRIGDLTDDLLLEPEAEVWRSGDAPSAISEVTLDVSKLAATLTHHREKIARCRAWVKPSLPRRGALPDFVETYDDWHV
jgi:CRISPR-associated protein Csh2